MWSVRSNILFCAAALFLSVHALPYSKNSGVLELTKKDFADQIFGTEHVSIVEFYAPCGHCKKLEPEMLKLASKNKGIFKVAAVNCDDEKELCGNFDIKGFPTLKVFPSQAVPVPKNKGKGYHKVPEDYNGPRSAGDMARAVLDKVPSFIEKVDDANLDKFLENKDLAKVILFTDKPKSTALYKAISVDYHNRLAVAEVRNTAKSTVEKYEITKFPTLIVLPAEGDKIVYSGPLSHEKISSFLAAHAKPLANQKSTNEPEKPKVPEIVHPVSEEIKDQETFEKVCHSSGKLCLIALLDPVDDAETHKKYIGILEKVQEKSKDLLHVIWINGPDNYEFGEKLGLSFGYPAVITYGHKKNAKIPHIGAFSEEDLLHYVSSIRSGGKRVSPANNFPKLKSSQPKKEGKKDELAKGPVRRLRNKSLSGNFVHSNGNHYQGMEFNYLQDINSLDELYGTLDLSEASIREAISILPDDFIDPQSLIDTEDYFFEINGSDSSCHTSSPDRNSDDAAFLFSSPDLIGSAVATDIQVLSQLKCDLKVVDQLDVTTTTSSEAPSAQAGRKRGRPKKVPRENVSAVLLQEDDLLALDSAQYERQIKLLKSSRAITFAEEECIKSQKRRIKNRESAHNSRERKRQATDDLASHVHILEQEIKSLRTQLSAVTSENQVLREELHRFMVKPTPVPTRTRAKRVANATTVLVVLFCFGLFFQQQPKDLPSPSSIHTRDLLWNEETTIASPIMSYDGTVNVLPSISKVKMFNNESAEIQAQLWKNGLKSRNNTHYFVVPELGQIFPPEKTENVSGEAYRMSFIIPSSALPSNPSTLGGPQMVEIHTQVLDISFLSVASFTPNVMRKTAIVISIANILKKAVVRLSPEKCRQLCTKTEVGSATFNGAQTTIGRSHLVSR
ncbi:hypothetical protein PROFUN_07051 [Planoprotostelium fungivorum]|uniref:protein disulfide-isomerase n=1 Tax=Planoprotostelium fungivorum TaxID=1890364 RepID=A0A2P6NMZ0_9EUKA|nr:hypothetical protein PROFUN_07051 [Planoprotostelium fungivorum]